MSEWHKLFMSEQGRSLHCTVPCHGAVGWSPSDRQTINQSINQSSCSSSSNVESAAQCVHSLCSRPIRQWQSHPSLAPGHGNGAETKRHQWPSDMDQQKSLVLISAPGGRPLFLLTHGAAGKSAGQATRARAGPSANSMASSRAHCQLPRYIFAQRDRVARVRRRAHRATVVGCWCGHQSSASINCLSCIGGMLL